MDGKFSYEKAGVSIAKGDAWIGTIKQLLSSRKKNPNAIGGIGGFSGLYRIGGGQCLAACCDGVGTKLEIARLAGKYRGLGQDLVAMNVNDLVTGGARPLFFLDYAACGKLDAAVLGEIVAGIIDACEESLCALLGGETAEMPGVYEPGGFDLAGFSVGIVDEDKIIDGSKIEEGDIVVGLASSGVHSNGYSLVRKALLEDGLRLDINATPAGWDEPLADALLRPTRLYVKAALAAVATGKIHAMAHITGGGMMGNITRVIPEGLDIEIDFNAWRRPKIFDLIAKAGVGEKEMRGVFNLGIGYVFVIKETDLGELINVLSPLGEKPITIGRISKVK